MRGGWEVMCLGHFEQTLRTQQFLSCPQFCVAEMMYSLNVHCMLNKLYLCLELIGFAA